jgi:polysaccharide biosynthesis protein VpsM
MKKRLLVLLTVSMSFLLFSYQASFAGEGKIVLKPHINVSWQSDSNFWWAEEDEKEVYTFLIQPGVTFGYETDKTKIHLDYTLNGYLYSDQDPPSPGIQKASDDNYIGHTLSLDASTRQLDEKLLAGVREDFYLTRDPAQSDTFNDSAVRNKYFINRVEPFAFYDLSDRFTVGVRYRNTITDYTEENLVDSTENRGLADVIYRFSETASLDLGYQVWARDYSKDTSAYLSNQGMLTYQQQFRWVSLEAGAGYQYRSFDEEYLGNISIVPWRLGIEIATDPAPISALLPEEQKKSYAKLMLAQDFNDQAQGERYFKADRLTLDIGHTFLERILVRLNGYYQRSKYEFTEGVTASGSTEKRDDDTYKVYGTVGYKFLRWFTLSIKPGYERRNSNIVGRSYEDKIIMAELEFLYDVGGK